MSLTSPCTRPSLLTRPTPFTIAWKTRTLLYRLFFFLPLIPALPCLYFSLFLPRTVLSLPLSSSLPYTMLLSSSELTLISIGVTVLVTAFKRLRTWRQDRAFAGSHGCQRPVRLSRLRNIVEQVKSIKSHTWLEMWCHRYSTVGTTFESATVTFEPIIFTNDPENIKTILATDFKTFELGDRRRQLMGPLVGPGVFSNDGLAWSHSRVSEEGESRGRRGKPRTALTMIGCRR